MISNTPPIGWRFDNSYARLPSTLLTKLDPVPVKNPSLLKFNNVLAEDLDLSFSNSDNKLMAGFFSGNVLPRGSLSIAQAYAGHQFGYFTMLGDGRATLIGEHITKQNRRFDIQLKGSGRTPYSRGGDGRAALGPVLREYIISEAMHFLKIPTTRSLAVVETGERVFRETDLPGAILVRVADSHIRVGTFQYLSLQNDVVALKALVDYSVNRHFSKKTNKQSPAILLLKCVIEKQISLVVDWMRVGFVHGVMNTDNMTISGETIDYGPCAFMDNYHPKTVFSSIDLNGRYSYTNQPAIMHWNLLRFAEALLPLIHEKNESAIKVVKEIFDNFNQKLSEAWLNMMRKKIGLFGSEKEDGVLIGDLLNWMEKNRLDFTNTFVLLGKNHPTKNSISKDKEFLIWQKKWLKRLEKNKKGFDSSFKIMSETNPTIIPRNHIVEGVLATVSKNKNVEPLNSFIEVLKKPYEDRLGVEKYKTPPKKGGEPYKTFCGT